MQLGMVGLGRMGGNMVRRLRRAGHECVVHDVLEQAVRELATEGATPASDLTDLVSRLGRPRTVWLMLPIHAVESTLGRLAGLLGDGDVVVDGGNSNYREDAPRAALLAKRGIGFVDCGVSGGVFGLERGYCLMLGGEGEAITRLAPILDTLAPGMDAAPRTSGRGERKSTAERGWLHCGPHGAGHFAKMVHNGIEYGLMAAYVEGFNILRHAESLPDTPYRFDLAEVAELWRRGSVISSWLLDLTAAALARDPQLDTFQGNVSDSGEGRWTVETAIQTGVPAHVITAALFERFSSRGEAEFQNRMLSAMRFAFGGHLEPGAKP